MSEKPESFLDIFVKIIYLCDCNHKKYSIMKKMFFLVFAFSMLMLSCSQPKVEDKIKALVETELKSNLLKPETYQLSNITIDSCFTDNLEKNMDIMLFGIELSKAYNKYLTAKEEANKQEVSMDIWKSFPNGPQYRQAKESYEKASKMKEDDKTAVLNLYKENIEAMREMASKHEFTGVYQVIVSYKAETRGGDQSAGQTLYYVDKNGEKILFAMGDEELVGLNMNALQDIVYEFADELAELAPQE